MMDFRPAIIGIAGPELAAAEAELLAETRPAGVILFGRNIQSPAQLARLMADLRRSLPVGAALMVDQEGGRVARLRPPHWRAHPPASRLGALHAANPGAGLRAAWLTGALIGLDCAGAGFTIAAAPVLDVASPDGHDVIGDRSFSANPEHVAALGAALAHGLLAAGVQPVGKHAPGHGRARADSHLELPVLDDVTAADLAPFRANAWLPWLMTAHIRYTARDVLPATQSAAIIRDIIRATGFDGVLTTDDLAMQALSGTPAARAAAAIAAGCDIALHCSGVLAESAGMLRALPPASEACAARLRRAAAMAQTARQALDGEALAAERAALLA